MNIPPVLSLFFEKTAGALRSRTPIVIQSETTECGLACLAMVAGHHGYSIDLPAMRRKFSTSLQGSSLRHLTLIATALSLATRALKADLPALKTLRLPCVLHWDHNHFVVLTKVDRKGIVIHDPGLGRRCLSLDEASKHFTGVVLEAWPTEQFERKTEKEAVSIWEMVKRTRGLSRSAFVVLGHSLLLEAVTIAMPIAFQLVIDQVVVTSDHDLLTLIVLGLFLLLMVKVFTSFIRSRIVLMVGSTIAMQWKVGLFDHLMRLPLDFFEKRHVGDVVSRFGSLDEVQKTVTNKAVFAIVDGLMSIALVFMMVLYGGSLILVAAISTLLYALLRSFTYARYRSLSDEVIVHEARENSHFMETVRGAASLKALNLEAQRRSLWINYLVERVGAKVQAEKFNIVFQAAGQILFGADRILMIYLGGSAILSGSLSVGMFIAFLSYKDQFADRINNFLDTFVSLRMLSLHGERIADIALTTPEEDDLPSPAIIIDRNASNYGSLSLRNIGFRYSENQPDILKNVSMTIDQGASLAIIGPSGAGKSTLLKIMGGLIKPTHGEVIFSGQPVDAIGRANYRDHIGFVLQEDRLFTGSIADNIAGFASEMDRNLVQFCARLAAIHDDIMQMPMTYETMVGDMGCALSSGQRQRIILARALYRKPKLLLLDEATSHLDEDNEARVNAALKQLSITRVIVAHRPSSIAVADHVFEIAGVSMSATM
ncbi:peptidase domain-containing ABC transporter [Oryzifoliimicrobium ureilyticus]|uniref:peptidase domain-containing ABC transporter n=1 Tax=Oryzifoliimicrobium ureilyticus TaxID=3113724 RepID=UPI0030767D40